MAGTRPIFFINSVLHIRSRPAVIFLPRQLFIAIACSGITAVLIVFMNALVVTLVDVKVADLKKSQTLNFFQLKP